ncbi:uncharacterized protein LOC124855662 [Girardinichthys multiradiatus]|uniref:uncharacterized protein LOC124855662 n=1 Tax=Girardinichthys multiradiatus TaxID=208333 RepID=UPI001FAD15EB|nr:uncharacterized protein LOC124855662 [Girardinichthys multiradiatus]
MHFSLQINSVANCMPHLMCYNNGKREFRVQAAGPETVPGRPRVQVAGQEAVPGRSGNQRASDIGAGDQHAGNVGAEQTDDVGADDLKAGVRTRRTHGGAQRHRDRWDLRRGHGDLRQSCQDTASGEGASLHPSGTGTGSGDRSSTTSSGTGTRDVGSSSSEPSRTGPGTRAGSGSSPFTRPSRTGTQCEGGSAWDPPRTELGTGSGGVEAVHPRTPPELDQEQDQESEAVAIADQELNYELESRLQLQWRGERRRGQEASSLKRRFLPGPFVARPQWCGESEDQGKNPSSPRASLEGCQLFSAFSMVS